MKDDPHYINADTEAVTANIWRWSKTPPSKSSLYSRRKNTESADGESSSEPGTDR
jgi:hypothetical protein